MRQDPSGWDARSEAMSVMGFVVGRGLDGEVGEVALTQVEDGCEEEQEPLPQHDRCTPLLQLPVVPPQHALCITGSSTAALFAATSLSS